MSDILLKVVEANDKLQWLELSHEFDVYIEELVGSLSQWYDGDESDITFLEYMNSKIAKKEAIMAIDRTSTVCLGILAFSRNNNKITFFGISHMADFESVSKILLDYSLSQLDTNKQIMINIIKSDAEIIDKERRILTEYGFRYCNSELENGVPVDKLCRM